MTQRKKTDILLPHVQVFYCFSFGENSKKSKVIYLKNEARGPFPFTFGVFQCKQSFNLRHVWVMNLKLKWVDLTELFQDVDTL